MALTLQKDYLRYRGYFLDIVAIYKTRRNLRVFMEIILSVVTISVFAVFALRPTILTIIDLVRQIRAKEAVLVQMDKKIADLKTAQGTYLANRDSISLLDRAIPSESQPQAVARQLEGMATTNAGQVLALALGETALVGQEVPTSDQTLQLPEGAHGVNFTFSTTADFTGLSGFLTTLEKSLRPIKFNSVTFNSAEIETGQQLILLISGQAPYLK